MKAMLEFSQKELNAGAEYIDAIQSIFTVLGGSEPMTVVEKVQLFFGKEIVKDYGLVQVSVSKDKVIIGMDVSEDLVVELMEIYRDFVKDITTPVVALIQTFKVLADKYDSRFNSFAEKLSAQITKE